MRTDTAWRCVAEISVQSMNRKIGDSLKFIPICMGITGLLLLIILYQDVDRITRPLHKLSAASKCIGEGNLDTRVEINTTDEIQELGDTINTMAENLQRYIKKSIAYEKDMVNMEIDRLMLQINPHFIYNTLSTISYMAEEEGNDRIGTRFPAGTHAPDSGRSGGKPAGPGSRSDAGRLPAAGLPPGLLERRNAGYYDFNP